MWFDCVLWMSLRYNIILWLNSWYVLMKYKINMDWLWVWCFVPFCSIICAQHFFSFFFLPSLSLPLYVHDFSLCFSVCLFHSFTLASALCLCLLLSFVLHCVSLSLSLSLTYTRSRSVSVCVCSPSAFRSYKHLNTYQINVCVVAYFFF